jgi:phosphatidylinositol dimannoside acyltransferase
MPQSATNHDATDRPRGIRTRMMKVARIFIARIPPRLGHPLAALLGELVYYLAAKSRRAVMGNIRHALCFTSGTTPPRRLLKKSVRHVFHNVMRNYYELCRAPEMTDADIDHMIDFDAQGWKRIEEIHGQGRGVLMVSAHFGSFDMVTQVLARHGLPATALVAQVKPAWLSDFITDLRADRGLELIMVDEEEGSGVNLGALKQSINLLRSGGLLGVVADRNLEQRGAKIKFFGYDTIVAAGVAKMAMRTKAAIIIGMARRLDNYRFSLTWDEPIEPEGSASNEEDVRVLLQKVFNRLQTHIGQNPEQWVLLSPVWPSTQQRGQVRAT